MDEEAFEDTASGAGAVLFEAGAMDDSFDVTTYDADDDDEFTDVADTSATDDQRNVVLFFVILL